MRDLQKHMPYLQMHARQYRSANSYSNTANQNAAKLNELTETKKAELIKYVTTKIITKETLQKWFWWLTNSNLSSWESEGVFDVRFEFNEISHVSSYDSFRSQMYLEISNDPNDYDTVKAVLIINNRKAFVFVLPSGRDTDDEYEDRLIKFEDGIDYANTAFEEYQETLIRKLQL